MYMETHQANKFSNHNWNPDQTSMEEQALQDEVPFNSIFQSYPHQPNQPLTGSRQVPFSTINNLGDKPGNHMPEDHGHEPEEELGAMKEMMYRIAAMQPVDIDPGSIRKPKRRNVRISNDPQSVAARHRRERISEKIRILQRLVPGGIKLDTASMLDEAIRYVKFLKRQIRLLQSNPPLPSIGDHWQVAHNNIRPLGSTSSSSLDPNTILGYNFGFNGAEPMCFNNEVISD